MPASKNRSIAVSFDPAARHESRTRRVIDAFDNDFDHLWEAVHSPPETPPDCKLHLGSRSLGHGWLLCRQAEYLTRSLDFESQLGPERWARFYELKDRFDPDHRTGADGV